MVHKADYVSDGGVPIVNPINIVAGDILNANLMMVSNEKAHELNHYRLSVDDILIARRGDLKKCAIVKETAVDWLCGTGSFFLHVPYVESRYIQLFYLSEYVQTILSKECVGATMDNLNQSVLGAIPFLLPPQKEQRRIISEVDKWFSLIDTLESAKEDLQTSIAQTKSKILDLAIHGKLVPQDPNDEPAIELLKRINPKFSPCDNAHYENLPKGWTEINVGELAQYTNGKAFQPSDWEQRGLPIIRIQNLNDENCKYNYTSIGHEEKYRITNGDLLFAWAASLGVYIWKGDDAWLNQHIFKVEPLPFIDKQFLYYLFQYLVSEFYNRSHGSGMVHITKKEFETTIALLPPLSEQSRIVKSIESYYATLDSISANL